MSKINVFRAVNVNYNNNANRIEDETFEFDGESTLLSLQNGGGKTVLVQMMTAPFVHKKYRNTTDRPFSSFFTTNRPTFLMVEWRLDGGAGYVLTGMMVRKAPTGIEETNEELEMLNFIYEYKDEDDYDIHRFPIIEKDGKQKKLKGFNACRQMFEEIRKEKGVRFQFFDMTQSLQQRQYFNRLKEYGINYEEWETIIKKINVKESGLSELFKEAKDEAGLVEKWFLPAVETKLNKEENRIKQFQTMLLKFIRQYKENESKIKRKDTILLFQEDAKQIKEQTAASVKINQKATEEREKIVCLRSQVIEMMKEMQASEEEEQKKISELEEALREIRYEEASYLFYQLLDRQEFLVLEQEKEKEKREKLEEKEEQLQKQLHIQVCAKAYQTYVDEEKEVLYLENQLEIVKKDEEERAPERNNLGYSLRLYYEEQEKKIKEQLRETEQALQELQREQEYLNKRQSDIQIHLSSNNQRYGVLKGQISSYGEEEARFCKKFSLKLERNILGTYEAGMFEILKREQEKKKLKTDHELTEARTKKTNCEEEKESIQRNIQDCNHLLGQLGEQRKYKFEKKKHYEMELEKRRQHMRYLSLGEENLFDQEYLCTQFAEKASELMTGKDALRKELDKVKEDYYKLKNGVVLEIPEEFKNLLHFMDLPYVMGMEYLKKNGFKEDQNQELLIKIPILPYCIIMSEKDLEKLAHATVNFYTSYPVPILVKEQLLAWEKREKNSVFALNGVSFFIMFNEHLLNEQALQQLLAQKEQEMESIRQKIDRKTEEIEHYEKMKHEISYQEVTKEEYEKLEKHLLAYEKQISETEQKVIKLRGQKNDHDELDAQLEAEIKKLEIEQKSFLQLLDGLEEIENQYRTYLENQRQFEKLGKQIQALEKEEYERKVKQEVNVQERNDLNIKRIEQTNMLKITKDKASHYQPYQDGIRIEKELVDIESRFLAITEQMGQNVKQLEAQLTKTRQRFTKVQEEIISLSRKFQLNDSEYRETPYDRFLEQEIEQNLEDLKQQIKQSEKQSNTFSLDIAVIESKLKDKKTQLREKFQEEEPIAKEKIRDLEFKKREKLTKLSIEEEKEKLKKFAEQRIGYEANISALSEFSTFPFTKEYSFKEELAAFHKQSLRELNRQELEKMHGTMVRDYRICLEQKRKQKSALEKLLDILSRKKEYGDDFYRQPLELMCNLTEEPAQLEQQLDIILLSYQTLLQKLEVDISLVEREKLKVVEMLLDYIEEIHRNLDKIDRNSTITLKERSIKMLRIQVPSWEENKEIYTQRMNSFITELTNSGLACMHDNGNIEEMVGMRITTKQLYDTVVGIGMIVIKLYKIEAQREYPITWTQVSKNSGGEGFLSAFVVLVSLLSYMRREESDFFTEREEGKVLVMDNPFAQTNASHLLIPLMEIAKKSNTQLICLTGLGGESIYNRFDNIYVINLMESGIQKDIQYLKAEHIKENTKVYQMSSSRMEITESEQLSLLF